MDNDDVSIFANSSSGAGNGVSTERYATPCDTPLTKKVQDTRGRCGTGGEAVGESAAGVGVWGWQCSGGS